MMYENTQTTLIVKPGDIEVAIADSLSRPFSEFIPKFIRDLITGRRGGIRGCAWIVWLFQLLWNDQLRALPFKAALQFMRDNLDHGGNTILVMYLK